MGQRKRRERMSSEADAAMLPYARQDITDEDVAAVVQTLRSDWLTCGPRVDQFEQALATAARTAHAIAVCNGTAALHLALQAAGIGPGDRVLTSANTFLASANAAEYTGATADFADIDPETRCLSLETLKAAWKPDVKAVVAVDFAGYPCVTEAMAEFIHQQGAVVIEDACHAIGGQRDGYPVGGLPWVDATTYSFHPVKNMTTGEGGAVLTARHDWAESCRTGRCHGMMRDPVGDRPYTMDTLGYNYRITDLQCAIGIGQLQRLNGYVHRRRELVARYNQAFAGLPGLRRPPMPAPGIDPAWHLYAVAIDFDALGTDRETLRASLLKRGIGTQLHYYPVHLQPYYMRRYGYHTGLHPEAERWFRQCLSLPLFPGMTDDDATRVIEAVTVAVRTAAFSPALKGPNSTA